MSAQSAGRLGLVTALVLTACRTAGPSPPPPPGPPPRAQPWEKVPLGLCEDYPISSRSLSGVEQDLKLLEKTGVKLLRVSIGWDSVEPEQDHYDFAFWDAFVERARSQGVRLIPYVAYTPAWAADGGTASDFWKRPPRDDAQFAEIMTLLATRYRDTIESWEIWNEPDNAEFWTDDVARYARLLAAGSGAVRMAQPNVRIVTGGLAGRIEFLMSLFAEQHASPFVDVVNLHSYYETWNPGPLESVVGYVAQAATIVERYGAGQPIWMAEVGYSNYRQDGVVSPYVNATYRYEHTLDFQAVALVRTVTMLYASPFVSLIAWYELKDPPDTDPVIGDQNNRHLGISFADRSPKPALESLHFMQRTFSSGFRGLDSETQYERPAESSSVAHAFLTAGGRVIVAAWLSKPKAPPAAANAETGAATDERRETLRVLVRRPVGNGLLLNARGAPTSSLPVTQTPRGWSFTLELRGGEVAVADLPAL